MSNITWNNISAELDKLDIFMNIGSETATIHIASAAPTKVPIHWEQNIDGFIKMIVCPGSGCPLCKAGSKLVNNYRFAVLDRATKAPKIVTAGKTLTKAIGDFARTHGDPCNFDLKITKHGMGKDTRFSFEAQKVDLSDDEKKMFTSDILSVMTSAQTPETILRDMKLKILTKDKIDEEWKAFEKSFEK